MNDDGFDQGVNVLVAEGLAVVGVDPVDKLFQPLLEAMRGRWRIDRIPLAIFHDDRVVNPEGPGAILIVVDPLHAGLMKLGDQLQGKRFVPVPPGELHHLEIAKDHLLIGCPWLPLALEHVLGDLRGGGGAFQLAAADRFIFDQVVEQVFDVLLLADVVTHPFKCGVRGVPVALGYGLLNGRGQEDLPGPPRTAGRRLAPGSGCR
ncbi:hypothetical protein D9M71_628930 [compost metagenome]